MTSLGSASIRRFSGVLTMVLALIASMTGVASADSTTSTSISVQVVDVGTLEVAIGPGDIVFITESGSAPGITTESGDTAYATVPIVISDTRTDQTRAPYSIVLSMGSMLQGDASISASNLSITGVSGLPGGLSPGFSGATSLSTPVTIIQSETLPPSGTFTISVAVALHIPAGTVPGVFNGSISLDVAPGGSAS
jgi:hypothetical protein